MKKISSLGFPKTIHLLVVGLVLSLLLYPIAAFAEVTIVSESAVDGSVNSPVSIPLSLNGSSEEDVPVSLVVTHGTLAMSTTTGLTFTGASTGSTLKFEGSLSDLNTALATLTYTRATAGADTLEVSLVEPGEVFFEDTGNLYEYISFTGNWQEADANAQTLTRYGATGYLTTITSEEENDFVSARLEGAGWMGASDVASEGDWKWVTGPEAGTSFWSGNGSGSAVDSAYENWNSGEPNDSGGEDCGQFLAGASGLWNDLPCTTFDLNGYVAEFGQPGDEVTVEATNVDITITENQAPDDIALANVQVINDRAENGTVIGDLSGTDPDEGDTVTLSLVDDAGGAFSIVDDQLLVANTNELTSPSQTVTVRATDDADATYEEDFEITVNYVAPVIQDIAVTTPDLETPDQIRVTWNKEDADASHVDYGIRTTYGHTEEDVTDTVNLDLLNCATYDYRIRLEKDGNMVNGNNQDMTTRGCIGEADVISQNRHDINENTGGTVELISNGTGTKLSVPADFKDGETEVQFQVKKLEPEEVIEEISQPSRKNLVGDHMYDFMALTDVTDQITEFDEPIVVTMMYDDEEIGDLVEDTLRIHRWHENRWEQLENCSISHSTNTIYCQTSKFSVFGLFGRGEITTTPSQRNSSGKAATLRWRGMARGDFQDTGATVTKHNFAEAYAKSKEQIAKMNAGIAPKQKYVVNRWGEHVFAGYLAGRIGLERYPHRYQNIVRFGSGSLTKGRGIELQDEELMLASAPESMEDIIIQEPSNQGWADEYQLAKDRFQRPEESDDLFASAPVPVEKVALETDQVETHKNQRNYYRKKGIPDRKRDTSMVKSSRMDATKDMDTVQIRFGGKSINMSKYLKNLQSSVIGNYDDSPETGSIGVLNSLGAIAVVILGFIGIELYRHRKNKKTSTQ